MKLLLDENLSRHIVPSIQGAFPGSTQAVIAGLERASDREVWGYAKDGGYAIVTKDEDFVALQSMLGYPPKVVYLSMGNCTNQQVVDALARARTQIEAALADDDVGLVEVY